MNKVKVGSVWRRTSAVGSTIARVGKTVTVLSADSDGVRYLYADADDAQEYKCQAWQFVDRFVEVGPPTAAVGWDYAEADRLRKAAADAFAAYNEYAERKPATAHYPIAIPWELLNV